MYITTKKFILLKEIEDEIFKNLKIFQIYDIEVGYEYGMLLAGAIFIPNYYAPVWINNPFFILKHFMLLEEWREQIINKILNNE